MSIYKMDVEHKFRESYTCFNSSFASGLQGQETESLDSPGYLWTFLVNSSGDYLGLRGKATSVVNLASSSMGRISVDVSGNYVIRWPMRCWRKDGQKKTRIGFR